MTATAREVFAFHGFEVVAEPALVTISGGRTIALADDGQGALLVAELSPKASAGGYHFRRIPWASIDAARQSAQGRVS